MALAGWLVAAVLGVVIWLLMREKKSGPEQPKPSGTVLPDTALPHAVAVWQKTVDVQQHFNQIEMDIRKTALTIVLTVIGAAGYVAEKGMSVQISTRSVPLAFVLLLAGACVWLAFYFMDYGWYHRLLRGSIDQGMALERDLKTSGVPIDLTNLIGERSPIFIGRRKLHSNDKIKLFYRAGLLLIGFLALMSFIIRTPPPPADEKKTDPPGYQNR